MLPFPRFAIAAAVWAALFALPNLFWATGADFASDTIAADPKEALGWGAEPPALLMTGLLKLILGLFALSFLVPRLPISNRRHVIAGVLVAVGLLGYGLANLAGHVSMLAGASDISPELGEYAVRWHTFFWDPVWLLGGALFALTVQAFRREAA